MCARCWADWDGVGVGWGSRSPKALRHGYAAGGGTEGSPASPRRRNLPRSGAGPSSEPGLTPLAAAQPDRLLPTRAPRTPTSSVLQRPSGRHTRPPAPPPGARWSDDTAGCVTNRRGPRGGGLGHAPRAASQWDAGAGGRGGVRGREAPPRPPSAPRPRPSRPAPHPRAAAGAGRRAGPAPNPPAGRQRASQLPPSLSHA